MKVDRQVLIAALIAGTLALVGCGGSSDSGTKFSVDDKSSAPQEQVAEPEPAPEPEPEPSERDETYIRPEFAQAMQDYEDFYRSYVDLLLLMEKDPTAPEVMLQLADMTAKEAEVARSFDAWDDEDLTDAELALYLETHAHVMEMLAEVM